MELSAEGRPVGDSPCPHASALTVRGGYDQQGQHSAQMRTANSRMLATLQSRKGAPERMPQHSPLCAQFVNFIHR
jgi:hypothetical protein